MTLLGNPWWHYLVWAVILTIVGRINIWLYHWQNQRQGRKFLQMVRIEHPEATITYATASSRDDVALRKIRKQFMENPNPRITFEKRP